jgi:hypothetical protein
MYFVGVGFDPDLKMLPENRLLDMQMFTLQTAVKHCATDTTVRELNDYVADEVRQRFGNHFKVNAVDPRTGEDMDMEEIGESAAKFAADEEDIEERNPDVFVLAVSFLNISDTVH